MSTLREIELECPICERHFCSQVIASAHPSCGRRTDFHLRTEGTQSLPYEIHSCDRCGYSGTERDFAGEADISPFLKEHVWGELAPRLSDRPATGSEKYEAAAKVAEWQGAEPRRVGDLLLRAAWCCVDEEDTEAERFFRRKAAWAFEAALQTYDEIARDERAAVTYLVGELWRRIGDVRKARQWFDAVPDEVVSSYKQRWIVEAARQQRDNPKEWFSGSR